MGDSGAVLVERMSDQGYERDASMRVVLTTEGTYPHFKGGVSTWCQSLLRGMPEIDFSLWALMMNPFVANQFEMPGNVKSFTGVPLWGVEEPSEYSPEIPASKVVYLSRRTTEKRTREGFVPLLERLLREIASPDFDPGRFGMVLYEIHLYFQNNDYRSTFRSLATWEVAKSVLLETNTGEVDTGDYSHEIPPEGGPRRAEARARIRELWKPAEALEPMNGRGTHLPTLNDATEGLRWLYRLLTPLNMPIPDGDLIHSSAAAFCGIPAILAKIERGTPFLLTEHGVYMREQYLAIGRYGYPFYLKKFVVQMVAAISRACFYFADQISPVCEFNARWELRNGATPDRLKVIYNGVDPVAYSPRAVARPSAPTVIVLARIDPLKDFETMLDTAEIVRRQIPNVQFLVYGPDSDREYAEKVRAKWHQMGLESTVKFQGETSNAPAALNQGDVVLMTSISEAFPFTVIEGMMCGKPVVSTDVGGVREALEGFGVLARAGDAAALAAGVVQMLELDPQSRQELETACRDRALNYFTLNAAVDNYRTTYLTLTERARRGDIDRPTVAIEAEQRARLHLVTDPVVPAGVESSADALLIDVAPAPEPSADALLIDVAPAPEMVVPEMAPPLYLDDLATVDGPRAIDVSDPFTPTIHDPGVPDVVLPVDRPSLPTSEPHAFEPHAFEAHAFEQEQRFEPEPLLTQTPVAPVALAAAPAAPVAAPAAPVAPMLDSEDPAERLLAFDASARTGGITLARAVRSLIVDPDPTLRIRALGSVSAAMRQSEAIALLSTVMRTDPDTSVRAEAASALARALGTR